jgi:hypothetical protein
MHHHSECAPFTVRRRTTACKIRAVQAVFALSLLAAASTAGAQSEGRGFLFKRPIGTFSLHGGFDRAQAGSDIFDFVTDTLTLGRKDFDAISFGADLAFQITPRIDLTFSADYAASSAKSEFRHWTDLDDLPIEQTTSLRRIPLSASVKAYLKPRGQTVGRFAWIPSKYSPFVGAGGGAMWYRFRQEGDFIDFQTLDVFGDLFDSRGWTPTAHALAGVDFSIGPRFVLTTQGKYTWAKAEMSGDFTGFDKIDLSGLAATLGINVRF